MRQLIIFTFSLIFATQVCAASPLQKADAAYRQKEYAAAVALYEQCLKGDSTAHPDEALTATLYYNMGNCYYRMKDYPHAVLYYQRSLRLNPANDDAAFNLQLTQTKLTDRFDTPSEMFFISWAKSLVHSQGSNAWGLWAIGSLIIAFVLFATYYFASLLWMRKLSFGLTLVAAIAFVCCQIFALLQHNRYNDLQQAVVMQTLNAYDSPTGTAKVQRMLHEGTLVTLLESYKGGWVQVELPDESNFWIKDKDIERVANSK